MNAETSYLAPKQMTYHVEADTVQFGENSSVLLHEALSSQGYCTR